MAQTRLFIVNIIGVLLISLYGCVSQDLRLPNSVQEIYNNQDVQQSLLMAAENGILFSFSQETLMEVEKTDIDPQCRSFSDPIWSTKLIVILNSLRKKPELLSKFHILEIKKGNVAQAELQTDQDGVRVLSVQYVMSELRGAITLNTELPCEGRRAEYLGKQLVKTDFEFPTQDQIESKLSISPDKEVVERLKFKKDFLIYLAERGAVLKFSHDQSFEKTSQKKYVLASVIDKLSEQIKNKKTDFIDLYLKKINQNSKQAELVQLFSIESSKEKNAGVKVESQGELARQNFGQPDLTYLFLSFKVQQDSIEIMSLDEFNLCLKKQADDLGFILRRIASDSDRNKYLAPGFQCEITQF